MVSSPALALTLLFASAVLATPVFRSTDQSLLKVELFATDENAVIEAAVTNTGTTDLSVLKLGSILDDSNAPIKKVSVFNAGMHTPLPNLLPSPLYIYIYIHGNLCLHMYVCVV